MAPKLCSVAGCNRPHEARGWCKPHYRRVRDCDDLRPDEPILLRRPLPGPCAYAGCSNMARAGGLCKAHYVSLRPGDVKTYRSAIRVLLVSLKARPCVDCGLQWPAWAMDFHHRNPADKKCEVGKCRTAPSLHAEAAKCDLLCAICHRAWHHCDTMTSAVTV